MNSHIKKAKHNFDFHSCIDSSFKDKFFDWKITVLFYVSLHYLKALGKKHNIEIGGTHTEIDKSINPRNPNANLPLDRTSYSNYKALYQYSRTARYDGFMDEEAFEEIKELEHSECLKHHDQLRWYIKIKRGVQLE
jgi:hypothetical protein